MIFLQFASNFYRKERPKPNFFFLKSFQKQRQIQGENLAGKILKKNSKLKRRYEDYKEQTFRESRKKY